MIQNNWFIFFQLCVRELRYIYAPINVKPLGGGGRPGKGGGFELRSSFQFKCPTPGKLTLVRRVQIPHPRDISVVPKNANSPPLSRKRHRSGKKRIKHQKVVNKIKATKQQLEMSVCLIEKCHLIYIKVVTTP